MLWVGKELTVLEIRWSGFLEQFSHQVAGFFLFFSCFLKDSWSSVPIWHSTVPKFCQSSHFLQTLTPQNLSTHFSRLSPNGPFWTLPMKSVEPLEKQDPEGMRSQSTWFLQLLNSKNFYSNLLWVISKRQEQCERSKLSRQPAAKDWAVTLHPGGRESCELVLLSSAFRTLPNDLTEESSRPLKRPNLEYYIPYKLLLGFYNI